MSALNVLERLVWAGWSGLLIAVVALLACRIKLLHPAVKTWVCRIAFVKAIISLAFMTNLPFIHTTTWLSQELVTFLLSVWAAGATVVTVHCVRAYWAASQLRNRAQLAQTSFGLEVRELPSLPMPCVVGFVRPTLLVPDCKQVDPSVIQHELAHVKHLDVPFGAVAWFVQAVFWFVPGFGKLIAEHSLWQEVWADLASRKQLELEPSWQAKALLSAVSKVRTAPVASLGYRGEAKDVARRIEAMFVGQYSRAFGLAVALITCAAAMPLEFGPDTNPVGMSPASGPISPIRARTRAHSAPVASQMVIAERIKE